MILNAMATKKKTDENVNLFNYDNENDCCFIEQHKLVLISAMNMPVVRMIVALLYNIRLC